MTKTLFGWLKICWKEDFLTCVLFAVRLKTFKYKFFWCFCLACCHHYLFGKQFVTEVQWIMGYFEPGMNILILQHLPCWYLCLSLYSSSRPEATSSSEPRENAEQLHPGVISTSQNNTKTDTSHKSTSSPCCYRQDASRLVKSSAPSHVLSPVEYSCGKSVVQSNANRQHHKQRPRNQKHSGKTRLSRNIPENESGSFSSRTNVKSKVSWV